MADTTERLVMEPERAAEFGQMILDMVAAHVDLAKELSPDEVQAMQMGDNYTQMWTRMQTQLESVELRLQAADEVMRHCEAYRGDEVLDAAITHYKALRNATEAI